MDTPTKNLADVILALLQLLVLAIGAGWALWRFRRERTHVPRVGFDLSGSFFGPQRGKVVAEFVATISNHGAVKHTVTDVLLRVRGITTEEDLVCWEGHEKRLFFPTLLVEDNVIYKKKYKAVFVEPGVTQPLTYITPIPSEVAFVVARAEFRYDQERKHSVERVFAVRPAPVEAA